ncbi:hypothetical protein K3Z93_13440, partial [Pseudomonas aeruginosa]|nr:hypothetical protein [Pseudomonas aeruginosa]
MSRDRLYTWAGLWRSPSSSWEALRLEKELLHNVALRVEPG